MICHCGRILAALLALVSLVKPATGQTLAGVRHWSGQGVAPVYEGWDRNPDGSYNMWFGYMNRNFEETLDVPIGADNRFEPGSPDRGQPTFFDTRRHKDVFRVVVPAEFAPTAKLTWSITIRGTTETVGATLNPVWQIDRLRTTRGGNIDRIDSNTPPTATASASTRTVVVDTPIALEVVAADDGNPKRRGETIGMTVEWSKYRGPGQVTLTPAKQPVTGGKARATATFSEPGQYTLLAVVDDGSGESAGNFGYHCCWTNVQVQVVVEGKTSAPALTRTGASAPLTFARDVAPIFRAKCVQCHHEGTGAPMSLITHEQVRPWARSIRQRVANREMPPWHLDKTVGIRKYKNDLSLTDSEIDTIVRWVDLGAPAGNLAELPPPPTFAPEDAWHIGKPDLVVKLDRTHTMYPKGPDWWLDYFGETTLTEDRWIKAMEVRPGNRRIVHHVVVYAIEPNAPEGTPPTGVLLHEYAVGKYGDTFNENTSRLLKAGTRLRFDMHYFAIGEEQTDRTEMAFVFYPKEFTPKYEVRPVAFRNVPNDELEIPPNSVVRHDGYYRLQRPARIDAFQPHMHMRGKAMTLEAILPNNTVEVLSSVNNFDFNWHVSYLYADDAAPLLPAGTVLHIIGIHDNTPRNRRNPDPAMWVGFGERSVDDMLQVWINIVYLEDAEFERQVKERLDARREAK
jgi:hypothetical protein